MPPGRHVIDLTVGRDPGERLEEYQEAFGLPSALHEHPEPEAAGRRGHGRLRGLFHRGGSD